jgi:hypothetical protein
MRKWQVARVFLVLLGGGLAAGLAAQERGGQQRVDSKPGARPAPAKAQQGSWVTFLSHRSGHNVLYRMRPDGSDLQPIFGGQLKDMPGLGDGLAVYRDPHWSRLSPDSKYFTSWADELVTRGDTPTGSRPFLLHLGRADGTGPTRVLATVCYESVAWSPDSKRVAYAVATDRWPWQTTNLLNQPESTRIFLVNADGTEEEMVFEKPGIWHVQDWSPDSKALLLETVNLTVPSAPSGDLLEYDLTGLDKYKKGTFPGAPWQSGTGTSLLLRPLAGGQPSHQFSGGRYSPDGKSVAVTASRRPDRPAAAFAVPNFELGVIDRDKGTYRKVVSYPGEGYGLRGPICWSPGGDEILYSRPLEKQDKREPGAGAAAAPAGLGIWAIKADGTGERFLTTGWSPEWR